MRRSIHYILVAAAITLLVFLVAGGLCGILAVVGDRAAAQAVKGVAIVSLVCWGLCFVALVFLLAIAYVRSDK